MKLTLFYYFISTTTCSMNILGVTTDLDHTDKIMAGGNPASRAPHLTVLGEYGPLNIIFMIHLFEITDFL